MSDALTSEKPGLKAALAETVRTDAPVPGAAAAQQLALLPLRRVVQDEENAEPVSPPRGAGRPKGAKNKSTAEWREYLLSRYSAPLIALAETYSRTLAQFAADLGFKLEDLDFDQRLALFNVQLQCAKEMAPYVHQKQPIAIEGGEHGLIQLIINSGAATQQQVEKAGVMSLNFIEGESQQDQLLIGDKTGKSVADQSVVVGQSTENKEENKT